MDLHCPATVNMRKADKSMNLQLVRLSIAGHNVIHLQRQEQAKGSQIYYGLQGNELCGATLHE
jgi:hypothetical protein